MTTTTTTTTAVKDSFDRFGDDLAELLLQYLPIDDRLRLQSVSKQWLTLIFNTETHLVFDWDLLDRMSLVTNRDNYLIIKLFELIVSKLPNITAVTISNNSILSTVVHLINSFINLLIKYCHRLRHISIGHYYLGQWSGITDRMVKLFFNRFGQQLLTFKFVGNLKVNEVDNHIFNRQLFYKVVDGMPNLKTLFITSVLLNHLFIGNNNNNNKCHVLPKSLQSLNIELDNLSMPLLARFADIYGQQLTSLTIWSNRKTIGSNFIGNLFTTIGRNCRQLKSLEFYFLIKNMLTIKRMFSAINEHMSPQLRRLSLNCLPKHTPQYWSDVLLTSDMLNRLHGLTHFTFKFSEWPAISDSFFLDIHRNLPRLQSIHIDEVSISQKSIQSMGQLKHLTDVYLRCDPYNDITLTHLLIDTKVKHLCIEYSEWYIRQTDIDIWDD
ncbi:uncharacterized protein LOC128954388 [Oppia nitens]|uniref:uncharacterized protein LOC128954388 n=1 Tax=Oppia nitens TaxID=1686743 RepID=UPI0023DB24FD|nr:uncharacterized protein LOC128954388 [Oppia nitens]